MASSMLCRTTIGVNGDVLRFITPVLGTRTNPDGWVKRAWLMSLYSGNGILRGGVLTSYVDAKLNIYKADAIDQRLKIPVERSSH